MTTSIKFLGWVFFCFSCLPAMAERDFITEIIDRKEDALYKTGHQALDEASSKFGVPRSFAPRPLDFTPNAAGEIVIPKAEFGAWVYTRGNLMKITSPSDAGKLLIIADALDRFDFAERARTGQIPYQPKQFLGQFRDPSRAELVKLADELIVQNLAEYEGKLNTIKTGQAGISHEQYLDAALSTLDAFRPGVGIATTIAKGEGKELLGGFQQKTLRDELYERIKNGDAVAEKSLYAIYQRSLQHPDLAPVADKGVLPLSGISLKKSPRDLIQDLISGTGKLEVGVRSKGGQLVVLTFYQEQLKRYAAAMDRDGNVKVNVGDETKSLAKAMAELDRKIQETRRELEAQAKQALAERAKGLDPAKRAAMLEQRRREHEIEMWAGQEMVGAIASIVGIFDGGAAREISIIGGSAMHLFDHFFKIQSAIDQGMTSAAVLGGIAGMTSTMINLGTALFSTPPEQQRHEQLIKGLQAISEQVVHVSKQVEALHQSLIDLSKYVETRFDHTDKLVTETYKDLLDKLYKVINLQKEQGYRVEDLQQSINDSVRISNRTYFDLRRLFREDAEQELVKQLVTCNEHSLNFTNELPPEEIRTCLNSYYQCVVGGSAAIWFAGDPKLPEQWDEVTAKVNSMGLETDSGVFSNIRFLGQLDKSALKFPGLGEADGLPLGDSLRSIPRPANQYPFMYCADRYLELAKQYRDGFYEKSDTGRSLKIIISETERLIDTQTNVVAWKKPEGVRADVLDGHPFIGSLVSDYQKALSDTHSAVQGRLRELRAESLKGWNPWETVDSAKQEKAKGAAPRELPLDFTRVGICGANAKVRGSEREAGPAKQVALKIVDKAVLSLIPKPYLMAYDLGMGNLSVCYDEVRFASVTRWMEREKKLVDNQSGFTVRLNPYVMIRASYLPGGDESKALVIFRKAISLADFAERFQIDGNSRLITMRNIGGTRYKDPDSSFSAGIQINYGEDWLRRFSELDAVGNRIKDDPPAIRDYLEKREALKGEAFAAHYEIFMQRARVPARHLEAALEGQAKHELTLDHLKEARDFDDAPHTAQQAGHYEDPRVSTKHSPDHSAEIDKKREERRNRLAAEVATEMAARMKRLGNDVALELLGKDRGLHNLAMNLDARRNLLLAHLRLSFPVSFRHNDELKGLFYGAEQLPGSAEMARLLRSTMAPEDAKGYLEPLQLDGSDALVCSSKSRPEASPEMKALAARLKVFLTEGDRDAQSLLDLTIRYRSGQLSQCVLEALLKEFPKGQRRPELEDLLRRLKLFQQFYKPLAASP